MKPVSCILIIVCFSVLLQGQDNVCYEPPSLDFGGTKINYSYLVLDTSISQTACQGIVYDKHRGEMWIKPIEYDGMYIINMGTVSGTMYWAVDKKTNEVLWHQQMNHLDDSDERAFSIGFIRKRDKDTLELITYRGHWPWSSTPITAGRGGYPGRRFIDKNTGETLSDNWIIDSLQNDLNLLFFGGFGVDDYPQIINGTNVIYTSDLFNSNSDTMTLEWSHRYISLNSLIRYRNFPPYNQLEGLTASNISFNFRGINGSSPVGGYSRYGPYELSENENMYFIRFLLDNIMRTVRIVIDDWGNLISEEDITENVNNGVDHFFWVPEKSQELHNGNIRLNGAETGSFSSRHFGYVEINKEGDLIKDRKALIFDELSPFFLASAELSKRKSHLHIFRPKENNNIYIYEEFEDGSYRRAGELKNPNSSLYAFDPKQIWQMDNGDVFLHLGVRLDSIYEFSVGGWQCLVKIEANELGLTTNNTNPIVNGNIKVFPNPTKDEVFIGSASHQENINIELINRLGQQVLTLPNSKLNQNISLGNLPPDMYFIVVKDNKTGNQMYHQRIIKME